MAPWWLCLMTGYGDLSLEAAARCRLGGAAQAALYGALCASRAAWRCRASLCACVPLRSLMPLPVPVHPCLFLCTPVQAFGRAASGRCQAWGCAWPRGVVDCIANFCSSRWQLVCTCACSCALGARGCALGAHVEHVSHPGLLCVETLMQQERFLHSARVGIKRPSMLKCSLVALCCCASTLQGHSLPERSHLPLRRDADGGLRHDFLEGVVPSSQLLRWRDC